MSNVTRAQQLLKRTRKKYGVTQEKLSQETFQSRESISMQENGSRKINHTTARTITEKYNDPFVAMEAAAEYIGWGISVFDGKAADLHRASMVMATKREVREALEKLKDLPIAENPSAVKEFEKQNIKEALIEQAEASTFIENNIAALCNEYGFNWTEIWDSARKRLTARGYL
uniref:XRE family transcriptional regulator n=1 Tax=uncultured Allobacillus sp. TaxID=1638025 RepID=UPI002592AE12|nr:XRE family transcriptional regulator [uncultured Allobacillus sp.]